MSYSKINFSITTLILLTAVAVLSVSHFNASKQNATLAAELELLRGQLGLLHVVDESKIHATALPTYGPRQWRWRVQLPKEGRYLMRYSLASDIPESGLPSESKTVDSVFLDSRRKPIPGGKPFVISVAIYQRDDGKWAIDTDAHSGRSTAWAIRNPPTWLDAKSFTGWSVNTYGKNSTVAAQNDAPLVLLRYRKGKTLPGGAHTVEMEPTDGFIFWIERIEDQLSDR